MTSSRVFWCLLAVAPFILQKGVAQEVVIDGGAYNLANEYYEQAVTSYESGKYGAAVIKFGRAIRLNPNNADYFFGRATAYYELSQFDSAKLDIDRAIDLERDQPDYHYRAGNICFHAKQYEDAYVHYSKALETAATSDISINTKNCRYNRGVSALYLQQYEAAIADFTEIFNADPVFFEALHNRGVAYKNLKNYDLACEDFNRAASAGLARSKPYLEKFCEGKYR